MAKRANQEIEDAQQATEDYKSDLKRATERLAAVEGVRWERASVARASLFLLFLFFTCGFIIIPVVLSFHSLPTCRFLWDRSGTICGTRQMSCALSLPQCNQAECCRQQRSVAGLQEGSLESTTRPLLTPLDFLSQTVR